MAKLTRRQQDCLRLAAQGYTSKEIGRRLGISPSTVDNHLYAASQVMEVGKRAEAARLFAQDPTELPRQELPRQPAPLVEPDASSDGAPAITRSGWRKWLLPFLPPVGGKENALSPTQRLFAIGRIAFVSVLVFVACVIVIRMCFAALS